MSRNVGIKLLVQFSKYLESFSMMRSGIRYIWHKQSAWVFIETPCISAPGCNDARIVSPECTQVEALTIAGSL